MNKEVVMCYSGCKYENYMGDCRYQQCLLEDEIEVINKIDNLMQNGYDGLCNDDCGCGVDDLMPCGNIENLRKCKSAKKYIKNEKCTKCFYYNDCKGYCYKPVKNVI